MYLKLFLLLFQQLLKVVSAEILVNTSAGQIQGETVTSDGGIINRFLGIPYAEAPNQNNRFLKPKKLKKFEYPFVATRTKPYCSQFYQINGVWSSMPLMNSRNDEDCLYLNVYVPDKAENFPVMVFLEGENFMTGRGDIYDAERLAVQAKVLVVTLNYRVGVLGFFTFGNSFAPGNLGLWDQNMALQWVHDNIGAFGGNPNSVTLVGWSAGATSVALHSLSKYSKGLFQRAILQGGASSGPTVVNTLEDALKFSNQLVTKMKCTDDSGDTSAILTCLRGKVLIIPSLQMTLRDSVAGLLGSLWAPYIDGDFIKDDPGKLLEDSSYLESIGFYNLDILIGVNRNEGSHLNYLLDNFVLDDPRHDDGISSDFIAEQIIPAIVKRKHGTDHVNLTEYVKEKYLENSAVTSYTAAYSLYGDSLFVAPVVQFARAHSFDNKGSGDTFMYLFDYSSVIGKVDVPHGGELPYVFGLSNLVSLAYLMPVQIPNEDKTLSQIVVSYWSNFIKSGDPNSPRQVPVAWPEYDLSSERYLMISQKLSSDKSIGQHLAANVSFWVSCFPGNIGLSDNLDECPILLSTSTLSTQPIKSTNNPMSVTTDQQQSAEPSTKIPEPSTKISSPSTKPIPTTGPQQSPESPTKVPNPKSTKRVVVIDSNNGNERPVFHLMGSIFILIAMIIC